MVVEDLISTGGSVLETVEALREAGAEVLGVVSIFTYGMKKGIERMAAAGVKNVSLTQPGHHRPGGRGGRLYRAGGCGPSAEIPGQPV